MRALALAVLGRRLPITDGVITLSQGGPSAGVTIRRDRYGIPHIDASTEHDAWFGLGFCVGQDRSFQVEMQLRLGRGTLSALIGRRGLDVDRLSRRIGFRRCANRQLGLLDADLREQLQAYADGINQGRAQGCRRRAHEFVLLRAQPTPVEPEDVLATVAVESCLNAMNWDVELARLQVLRNDGPAAVATLDPHYPGWLPVTSPPETLAGPAASRLVEDLASMRAFAGGSGGSNNWVLAGSRTASGRPLLAGDPHLPNDLPPVWYLAHLRTPQWEAAGLTLGPAFVNGHNGHAAWAETNGYADNADLVVEAVAADGRGIRRGDHHVRCDLVEEVIHVRGGKPVTERVLITPDGPVIGPALDGDLGAIALRATWLQAKPVRGLFGVHRARSFADFRRCFTQWPAISLNYVYADMSGLIGWQLVGEVPQRRRGHGLLPADGSQGDPWLDDPVPFESMPHDVDPERGFLATANNKPTVDGDGPFLGSDWLDGFRVRRIVDRLASRDDWDVPSTLALQTDVHSTIWDDVKDVVLAVKPTTSDARRALALLDRWDGALAPDSAAATVFARFEEEMSRRIATACAPGSVDIIMGKGASSLLPYNTFGARRSGRLVRMLCEQPDGYLSRPWDAEIERTLSTVVEGLRSSYGPNSEDWVASRVRPLQLRHPLGGVRLLAPVVNRGPMAVNGDVNTVAQCTPLDLKSGAFAIPSARMVIDVGAWNAARFSLPGGQSGNPLSEHYDDLLQYWLEGSGVPIAWTSELVSRATVRTLRLSCEQASLPVGARRRARNHISPRSSPPTRRRRPHGIPPRGT